MPQIIDFTRKIRKYILFNPSIRPHELKWGGNVFTFPSRDDVRPEKSAKFVNGEWIPGTYVISDTYDGLDQLVFDAAFAIRSLLGLEPRGDGTQISTSMYGKFGIAYIPEDCTPEQYQEIRSESIRQWEDFRLQDALQTISDYNEKSAKMRSAGLTPLPPSRAEEEAQQILESARKRSSARIEASQLASSDSLDDDLELVAQARAAALELAERVSEGKNIDKAKLAEELWADPKVRAKLMKKYRIRKIGYADDTEESVAAEIAQEQAG